MPDRSRSLQRPGGGIVRGELMSSSWRFDRLFLFAILLYAVLTAAFAWHFLSSLAKPSMERGSGVESIRTT